MQCLGRNLCGLLLIGSVVVDAATPSGQRTGINVPRIRGTWGPTNKLRGKFASTAPVKATFYAMLCLVISTPSISRRIIGKSGRRNEIFNGLLAFLAAGDRNNQGGEVDQPVRGAVKCWRSNMVH